MSKKSQESSGQHINRRMIPLVLVLLVMVVLLVVIYGYVALQTRYDRQYLSLASEQRLNSQLIAKYAALAATGDVSTFSKLKEHSDSLDNGIKILREGNPSTGLPPTPSDAEEPLLEVMGQWSQHREYSDAIQRHQDSVISLRVAVQLVNELLPRLNSASEEVVSAYVARGADPQQIFIASRQLMLAQRIAHNVTQLLEGSATDGAASDRFVYDATLFGRVVRGMLNGDDKLGITRISDSQTREKIAKVNELFKELNTQVELIRDNLAGMYKVKEMAAALVDGSEPLLESIGKLINAYVAMDEKRDQWATGGYLLGFLVLLLLFLIALQLRNEGKRQIIASEEQKKQIEEQNSRNQQAILRLLDEMGDLADGDLTVQASVTESITGAIADSINYAIDALRTLVMAINDTTGQVSGVAQDVREATHQLANVSGEQAQQISRASGAITGMASSFTGVSQNAAELAEEAQRSVQIAGDGAGAVRKTIQGMDTIREQIQETSKRIKRLGESSQEIGDIVELINDISEQTNILALNAAIQAAMAGESGRGFAVVAGEVQQLAERSATATRQIESLVKTIQSDTNEAVHSMEQSTTGVVNGARLAREAGDSLGEIEKVSQHLADLIQNISTDTRQHAGAATEIADDMTTVQTITLQTSADIDKAAEAIGHLADLLNELKKSVAGFKLPA